jgi:hypothetical protein
VLGVNKVAKLVLFRGDLQGAIVGVHGPAAGLQEGVVGLEERKECS